MKKLLVCLSILSTLVLAEPTTSDQASDQPKVIMVKAAGNSSNKNTPATPQSATPKTPTKKTRAKKKPKTSSVKKHTSTKHAKAKKSQPATSN